MVNNVVPCIWELNVKFLINNPDWTQGLKGPVSADLVVSSSSRMPLENVLRFVGGAFEKLGAPFRSPSNKYYNM